MQAGHAAAARTVSAHADAVKDLNRQLESTHGIMGRINAAIAGAGLGTAGARRVAEGFGDDSVELPGWGPFSLRSAGSFRNATGGRGAWQVSSDAVRAAKDIAETVKQAGTLEQKFTALGGALRGVSGDLVAASSRFVATYAAITLAEEAARRFYNSMETAGAQRQQRALQSQMLRNAHGEPTPWAEISSVQSLSSRTGVSFDAYVNFLNRIEYLQENAAKNTLAGPTPRNSDERRFARAMESLGIRNFADMDRYQLLLEASARIRSVGGVRNEAAVAADMFGPENAAVGLATLRRPLAFEYGSQAAADLRRQSLDRTNAAGGLASALPDRWSLRAGDPATAIETSDFYRRLSTFHVTEGLPFTFASDNFLVGAQTKMPQWSAIYKMAYAEASRRTNQAMEQYAQALNMQVRAGELDVTDVLQRPAALQTSDFPSTMFPFGAKPPAAQTIARWRGGMPEVESTAPYTTGWKGIANQVIRVLAQGPSAAGDIPPELQNAFTYKTYAPLENRPFAPNQPAQYSVPIYQDRGPRTGLRGAYEYAREVLGGAPLSRYDNVATFNYQQPVEYGYRQLMEQPVSQPGSALAAKYNPLLQQIAQPLDPETMNRLRVFQKEWAGSLESVNGEIQKIGESYKKAASIQEALVSGNIHWNTLSKETREKAQEYLRALPDLRQRYLDLTQQQQPMAQFRQQVESRYRPLDLYGGRSQGDIETAQIGLHGTAALNFQEELRVQQIRASMADVAKDSPFVVQGYINRERTFFDKQRDQLRLQLQQESITQGAGIRASMIRAQATPAEMESAIGRAARVQAGGIYAAAALDTQNPDDARQQAGLRARQVDGQRQLELIQVRQRDRQEALRAEERMAQLRVQGLSEIARLTHRLPGDQGALIEETYGIETGFARDEFTRMIAAGERPASAFGQLRQGLFQAQQRRFMSRAQLGITEYEQRRSLMENAAGAEFSLAGEQIQMLSRPGREAETARLTGELARRQLNFHVDQMQLGAEQRQRIQPFIDRTADAQDRVRGLQLERQLSAEAEERADRVARSREEHQTRMIQLLAGPGGEYQAVNRVYELRLRAIDQEKARRGDQLRDQDVLIAKEEARKQREEQITQLVERQNERARSTAGGLFDAVIGQAMGNRNSLRSFGTSTLISTGRQMFTNYLQMRNFGGFGLDRMFGPQVDSEGRITKWGQIAANTILAAPGSKMQGAQAAPDQRLAQMERADLERIAKGHEETRTREEEITALRDLTQAIQDLQVQLGAASKIAPFTPEPMAGEMGDAGRRATAGLIGSVLSTIPQFAEGGVVTRPTVAVIGEKGPEAIIPLKPGEVHLSIDDITAKYARQIVLDSMSLADFNRRPGEQDVAKMRAETALQQSRERTEKLWHTEDERYGGHALIDVGARAAANYFSFTPAGTALSVGNTLMSGDLVSGFGLAALNALPYARNFRAGLGGLKTAMDAANESRQAAAAALPVGERAPIDWAWAAQFDPRLAQITHSGEGVRALKLGAQIDEMFQTGTEPSVRQLRAWMRLRYPGVAEGVSRVDVRGQAGYTGVFHPSTKMVEIDKAPVTDSAYLLGHEYTHAAQVRRARGKSDPFSGYTSAPESEGAPETIGEAASYVARWAKYWDQPVEVDARRRGLSVMRSYQRHVGILEASRRLRGYLPMSAGSAEELINQSSPRPTMPDILGGQLRMKGVDYALDGAPGWLQEEVLSRLPKFAGGGPVTSPTVGVYGEAGPEAKVTWEQLMQQLRRMVAEMMPQRPLVPVAPPQPPPQPPAEDPAEQLRRIVARMMPQQQIVPTQPPQPPPQAPREDHTPPTYADRAAATTGAAAMNSIPTLLANSPDPKTRKVNYGAQMAQHYIAAIGRGDFVSPIIDFGVFLQGRKAGERVGYDPMSGHVVYDVPRPRDWPGPVDMDNLPLTHPRAIALGELYPGVAMPGNNGKYAPGATPPEDRGRYDNVDPDIAKNEKRRGDKSSYDKEQAAQMRKVVGQYIASLAATGGAAYGAFDAFSHGNTIAGLQYTVGALSAVSQIPAIAGTAFGSVIGAAAPIVGAGLAIGQMINGNPKALAAKARDEWLRNALFIGPPGLNYALGMGGKEIAFDWRGGVSHFDREAVQLQTHPPLNPKEPWSWSQYVPAPAPSPYNPPPPPPPSDRSTPPAPSFSMTIHALDARSIMDRAGDIASVVQHAMRKSHPITTDIRRLART